MCCWQGDVLILWDVYRSHRDSLSLLLHMTSVLNPQVFMSPAIIKGPPFTASLLNHKWLWDVLNIYECLINPKWKWHKLSWFIQRLAHSSPAQKPQWHFLHTCNSKYLTYVNRSYAIVPFWKRPLPPPQILKLLYTASGANITAAWVVLMLTWCPLAN